MKSKISLIVAVIMLLSFSMVSLGAVVVEKIEAYRADDMKFRVDGEMWQPRDVDGSPLSPIIHNGRSYVPARALLEEKDVEVDFDDKTRTIILNYPDWQDPDEDNGNSDPPKDKSKYWDPDGGKMPEKGDILPGPIVWQIGGPYEELPDYTLIIEAFKEMKPLMDETTTTFNVDKDTKVMVNGENWSIEDLVRSKKSFTVEGDLDGRVRLKGDPKSNTINHIQFDGREIKDADALASKIGIEVTFSGPPWKLTIKIKF